MENHYVRSNSQTYELRISIVEPYGEMYEKVILLALKCPNNRN